MASKLIIECLKNEFQFKTTHFPGFDRNKMFNFSYIFNYLYRIMKVWFVVFKIALQPKPIIYANISQTYISLLRDALPLYLLNLIKPSAQMVYSLHGHNFTLWRDTALITYLFKNLLSHVKIITILGPVQQKRMLALGFKSDQVKVVNNTCEEYFGDDNYNHGSSKYSSSMQTSEIKLLYLSNLITSKGYRTYLKAISIVAERFKATTTNSDKLSSNKRVKTVLCGRLTKSAETEIKGVPDNEKWVLDKIAYINQSSLVNIIWVKGAYGQEKQKLFEQSNVFVFPTRYSTEAQPIVLIEAMAQGCAVLTTNQGEIASTVDESCAYVLIHETPESIADLIINLVENPESLKKMQMASIKRFREKFSNTQYKTTWDLIFSQLHGHTHYGP